MNFFNKDLFSTWNQFCVFFSFFPFLLWPALVSFSKFGNAVQSHTHMYNTHARTKWSAILELFGMTYEHVHGVHSELNSDQETNLDKMYAKRCVKETFLHSIPFFAIFFSFRLFNRKINETDFSI